jgi:hypothetical protein
MCFVESLTMLLSSILQILNQYQTQPSSFQNTVKPASAATFSIAQDNSGLQQIRNEIASAAGLLRPLSPEHIDPVTLTGPSLEELMQTIAKLKEPNKSRVVDVFE